MYHEPLILSPLKLLCIHVHTCIQYSLPPLKIFSTIMGSLTNFFNQFWTPCNTWVVTKLKLGLKHKTIYEYTYISCPISILLV